MSWQLPSWTELQSQPALVALLFTSSLSFPPADMAEQASMVCFLNQKEQAESCYWSFCIQTHNQQVNKVSKISIGLKGKIHTKQLINIIKTNALLRTELDPTDKMS